MGHVQKLGPGRFKARYRTPGGREVSKTFQRRIDADRFLTSVESAKLRGEWVDAALSRTTVGAWSERHMRTLGNLKPYTRATYDSLLRVQVLPVFGATPLGSLETVAVREWVANMTEAGLSPSRIRQAHQLLNAMCKSAVESRYLVRNPCAGVKLPRVRSREMRFLNGVQVEALAAATGSYSTLTYVLAYGGLRWGEACAIRRRRVDLLRGRLQVAEALAEVSGHHVLGSTKNHRTRTIAMPRFLVELLAAELERVPATPDALLFLAPQGGPLRHANFRRRVWQPALADAALPGDLRIHDLRHTTVALLVAQGAHPKAVQRHMGHSSIQVTLDTYGHLFPDEQDRLAEALDEVHAQAVAASVRPERGGTVAPLPVREAGP